jgi:hypothetical protein
MTSRLIVYAAFGMLFASSLRSFQRGLTTNSYVKPAPQN